VHHLKGADVADLIAIPLKVPPRAHYELADKLRSGRYFLCERVPCGDDDECYIVTHSELHGYQPHLFLRRFPTEGLDERLIEWFRRIARANGSGLEQVFEIGHEAGHTVMVTGLIEGVGLDQLDAQLVACGQRLPWEVALALLFDATDRIGRLRAAGALHGGVTPARLRFAYTGTLYLCHGAPVTDIAWTHALFAVVRPILRLAATAPERELLDGVLDDADSTEALAVASDALVLRHPELDPVLPMLFRALLDDANRARERARAMLAERLDATAVRQLWAIVRGPV
jgi:hypothetical protein